MTNLFRVLTAPQQTFERIREGKGGSWVVALLVLMFLDGVSYWLTLPSVLAATENALRKAGQLDANTLLIAKTTAVTTGLAGTFLSALIGMFILGLLLLLINALVGGEATYMQLSKVALYSGLPATLGSLLLGLIVRLTGAANLGSSISLGLFFSEKSGWAYQLASIIDPFALFGLVLVIIGTTVMTRRPRAKVAMWILIGWGLGKVLLIVSEIVRPH
ncbi:MAG: YIP1 family protein [Tumebacillaceae bacterium]